jgi:shikimate 5-dehydrogenase
MIPRPDAALPRQTPLPEEIEMLLDEKVAVIHGAGGAIGGAVARAFAAAGARVHLAGRTRARRASPRSTCSTSAPSPRMPTTWCASTGGSTSR